MKSVREKETAREAAKTILRGKNVGFIGGGNMAKAIAKGLLGNVLSSDQLYMSCPSEGTQKEWKEWGVNVTSKNDFIFQNCTLIILAFKPHQISKALARIPLVEGPVIIVSLLAGVSSDTVFGMVAEKIKKCDVIRVMPNLSVAVGEGTSVVGLMQNRYDSLAVVTSIFSSLGLVQVVEEYMMEPLAALVGCGPAYIFVTIEALADGAVKLGVPRELALQIATQVVLGASKLVSETGKHPAVLKDEVCSPGGTTIAGIHALENGGLRATFMNAIEASMNRAIEMKKAAK